MDTAIFWLAALAASIVLIEAATRIQRRRKRLREHEASLAMARDELVALCREVAAAWPLDGAQEMATEAILHEAPRVLSSLDHCRARMRWPDSARLGRVAAMLRRCLAKGGLRPARLAALYRAARGFVAASGGALEVAGLPEALD